jgi:NAD(P)H dehydrogenase (quinone)
MRNCPTRNGDVAHEPRTAATVLIVLAHPEPASFTAAWARASAEAAKAAGSNVAWSDLYGLGFDPVEGSGHYDPTPAVSIRSRPRRPRRLGCCRRMSRAEATRSSRPTSSSCTFPLWWFGPPAILKGWLDRCLVHGRCMMWTTASTPGACGESGRCFCVSTGARRRNADRVGRKGTRVFSSGRWPIPCGIAGWTCWSRCSSTGFTAT